MRIPSSARRGGVGFNMTPMIDVVFQLIIFFLVASHLAKQEALLPLPLPEAQSGTAADPSAARRLIINVLGDGRLLLAGKPVLAEELDQRLGQAAAESGRELEVRIRSDRAAPYRTVEPILIACARNGIENVAFAVYSAEESR